MKLLKKNDKNGLQQPHDSLSVSRHRFLRILTQFFMQFYTVLRSSYAQLFASPHAVFTHFYAFPCNFDAVLGIFTQFVRIFPKHVYYAVITQFYVFYALVLFQAYLRSSTHFFQFCAFSLSSYAFVRNFYAFLTRSKHFLQLLHNFIYFTHFYAILCLFNPF